MTKKYICKCQLCQEERRMKVRRAIFATLVQGRYLKEAVEYGKKSNRLEREI